MMRLAINTLAETVKEGSARETAKLVKEISDLLEKQFGDDTSPKAVVPQTHALAILLGYVCRQYNVGLDKVLSTILLGSNLAYLDERLLKSVLDHVGGNT